MSKGFTTREKQAIERYLQWRPETIIADRLWQAGYRTADLYPEGVLGKWMRKRLPDPYVCEISNLFRQWEFIFPNSSRSASIRDLSGVIVDISLMPDEIPVIRPKEQ